MGAPGGRAICLLLSLLHLLSWSSLWHTAYIFVELTNNALYKITIPQRNLQNWDNIPGSVSLPYPPSMLCAGALTLSCCGCEETTLEKEIPLQSSPVKDHWCVCSLLNRNNFSPSGPKVLWVPRAKEKWYLAQVSGLPVTSSVVLRAPQPPPTSGTQGSMCGLGS